MSLEVIQGGVLSLLQDRGRFGAHRIGLTNGGPLDPEAFDYCNRLLANEPGSTAVEISFGGSQLKALVDTFICVTGAAMPLTVNGREKPLWAVHAVAADDIRLGFAEHGCRSYLGVAGGFIIEPSFGSTATVVRENIGGLGGNKLMPGAWASAKLVPSVLLTKLRPLQLANKSRSKGANMMIFLMVP